MTWLWDAMWARIGWALGEVAIVVTLLVAFIAVAVIAELVVRFWQSRCARTRTIRTGVAQSETRCAQCRKLMGGAR